MAPRTAASVCWCAMFCLVLLVNCDFMLCVVLIVFLCFYVLCLLYAPSHQKKFQVGVNLLGNKSHSDSDSDSENEIIPKLKSYLLKWQNVACCCCQMIILYHV